jgi:hypothetical protein
MSGSLDPQRTAVFNLRDVWIEIWTEDSAGDQDTQLTEYWLYVNKAGLDDKILVRRNFQAGKSGKRLTTIDHDYTLNLSRFQAKFDEDFDLVTVSADATYRIKLIQINEQDPSITETRVLTGCQIESRSIKMEELVNNVPTQWAVGDYIPPS